MPKTDLENLVQLSVLDRLIDSDPKNSREAALTRAQSLRIMKEAIRRDLEWLLNSRQVNPQIKAYAELESSVLNYGLPDMSALNPDSVSDRMALIQSLEESVRRFEPRLQDVHFTLTAEGRHLFGLRFLIEGLLMIEPAPELLVFDTYFDGEICRVKET